MRGALFWDYDGTLVRQDTKWSGSLHAALAEAGFEFPYETVRAHLRTGFTWHTPEKDYVGDTGPGWWPLLFSHFEVFYREQNVPEDRWNAVNDRVRARILDPKTHTPFDDAIPTLRACRELGYENYILSNNFPELPDLLDALGFSALLGGCAVSAAIGYEKPRAEIFEYARRLAGNPRECWMIGDNPTADVEGGRAVGMKTILVHRRADCPADHLCDELAEIPALL